ncbi:MAG: hypothetical protein IJK61_02670 [Bacteroidetes bacterium]|nr:hypothetical protein [Bacteroidota bacterium]
MKQSKGDSLAISKYVDYSSVDEDYGFFSLVKQDYNIICKLSKKNEYCQSTKKNYYSKYTYSYHTWRLDYYDEYYHLSCTSNYVDTKYDESEEGSLWCVFTKINGVWKIIEFSGAD